MTPQLHNPAPDFSQVTLEDLIGSGELTEAAIKVSESFEKIRPKMDQYRTLRGFVWKLKR